MSNKPHKRAATRRPLNAEARARRARLLELMHAHSLTRQDVAARLGRKLGTVKVWLCAAQAIPADALRVLELELEGGQ